MKAETPNEGFVVAVNMAMARALKEGANPDMMAKVCLNTAREMYEHYEAGDTAENFVEFVISTEFEIAEIEEWLHEVEDNDG